MSVVDVTKLQDHCKVRSVTIKMHKQKRFYLWGPDIQQAAGSDVVRVQVKDAQCATRSAHYIKLVV